MVKKKFELPKEVKVGLYVVASGALTALIDYLTELKLDNLIVMAIINILIVSLQVRFPQLKAKLTK